jgi:hypothetical protein
MHIHGVGKCGEGIIGLLFLGNISNKSCTTIFKAEREKLFFQLFWDYFPGQFISDLQLEIIDSLFDCILTQETLNCLRMLCVCVIIQK